MKANELSNQLRNGNYINYIGKPIKCSIETIYAVSKCVGETAMYQPIELTEDLILNFGLVKYGNQFENKHIIITTIINPVEFICHGAKLKYVHQLQNLHFALRGEELVFSSTEP